MIDWFLHLRVRPNSDGLYPHPGMWLTRGDYTERWVVRQVMRLDAAMLAPFFCWVGVHRWISVGREVQTLCWYCEQERVP